MRVREYGERAYILGVICGMVIHKKGRGILSINVQIRFFEVFMKDIKSFYNISFSKMIFFWKNTIFKTNPPTLSLNHLSMALSFMIGSYWRHGFVAERCGTPYLLYDVIF